MEHENKVISFDFFELKAKDIRYCEMCEVSMMGIINHLYEAAKQRETKLYYFKEFYAR